MRGCFIEQVSGVVPMPFLHPTASGASSDQSSFPSSSFLSWSYSVFLSLCTIKQLPEKLHFVPGKE